MRVSPCFAAGLVMLLGCGQAPRADDDAGLDARTDDVATDALADGDRPLDAREAPDAVASACVSSQCALGGSGCDAAEACVIDATDPRPHCAPVGTRRIGSLCDDDPASCEAALVCHRHRCRWDCCTDGSVPGASPSCWPGWCRPLVGSLGACDERVCDPLFPMEECSPGLSCDVIDEDGTTECRPFGTALEGEVCDGVRCAPGLGCVRSGSDPPRCRRWCDPRAGGYPCPDECTIALGWGVCALPP